MFVANDKHRQPHMFSSITSLPQDELNLLKQSWAVTFYHEVFCRIDEQIFAEDRSGIERQQPELA